MSHAYTFKYIILGEAAVGKSSIRTAFGGGPFHARHDMTIGVEFDSKIITVEGVPIRISLYDAPGNHRFRKLSMPYYRSLACVIVAYDVTRRDTFVAAQEWMVDAKRNTRDDIVMVLVGNKRDRDDKRTVGYSEGQEVAAAHGALFFETSARLNEFIDAIFHDSALIVHQRILSGHVDTSNEFHGVLPGDMADPKRAAGGRSRGAKGGQAAGAPGGYVELDAPDKCCCAVS